MVKIHFNGLIWFNKPQYLMVKHQLFIIVKLLVVHSYGSTGLTLNEPSTSID